MPASIFRDYHTENAGTPICEIMPARAGEIPCIVRLVYEAGSTEHTLTLMKAQGITYVDTMAPQGGSTLELQTVNIAQDINDDDEAIAANDYICWVDEYNCYKFDYVASVSGSTITLNGTLPTDVRKGAAVWSFYEVGRAHHQQLKLAANETTVIEGRMQGGFSPQYGMQTTRTGIGEPMLLHIDNATNAGKLQYLSGHYTTDVVVS